MDAVPNERTAPAVNHCALPNEAVVNSRYLFRAMTKRTISMTKAMVVSANAIPEVRVMKTVPERW
jgi:hypothetical protein